jgi:hypothetical protein
VVLGDRTEQQALAKFEDTELVNPGCFADDGRASPLLLSLFAPTNIFPRGLSTKLADRVGSTLFSTWIYLQLVRTTGPHIEGPCGIDTTLICLFGRRVEPNHDFDRVRPGRG